MRYIKADVENEKVVEKSCKEFDQNDLNSECWSIQFEGLEACKNCEFLGTDECGGKRIRESLSNSKGLDVPLDSESC